MLRLTELKGSLQRSTFDGDFPSALYLTGQNGAGKTTVARALELLGTGQVTIDGQIKSQPGDIVSLSMDGELFISGVFDSGVNVLRHYKRTKTGGTAKVKISPATPGLSNTEAKKVITNTLGGFIPALGLNEFIHKSEDELRKFLFPLITIEKPMQEVRDMVNSIIEETPGSAETFELLPRLCNILKPSVTLAKNPIEYIEFTIYDIKEALKPIRVDEKVATGAIKAAQARLKSFPITEGLDTLLKKKRSLEEQLGETQKRITQSEERLVQLDRLESDLKTAEGYLAETPELLPEDVRSQYEALIKENDIKALRDSRTEIQEEYQSRVNAYEQLESDTAYELEALQNAVSDCEKLNALIIKKELVLNTLNDASLEIVDCETICGELRDKLGIQNRNIEAMNYIDKIVDGKCTVCGSVVDADNIHCDEVFLEEAKAKAESIQKEINTVMQKREDYVKVSKDLDGNYGDLREQIAKLEGAEELVTTIQERLAILQAEFMNFGAIPSAEEIDIELKKITDLIDAIEEASDKLEEDAENIKNIERITADIESIKSQIEKIEIFKVNDLLETKKKLQCDIDLLEAHIETQRERQDKMNEIEGFKSDLEKIKARYEFLTKLEVSLGPKGLLGDLLNSAIGPLVECTQNAYMLMGKPGYQFCILTYDEETDKDCFRLGVIDRRSDDNLFRPFNVLSRGERAVLGVALTIALTRLADPPWKLIIIDDFDSVDMNTRIAVLAVLDGFRDEIGNIVVLERRDDNKRPDYVPSEWEWRAL